MGNSTSRVVGCFAPFNGKNGGGGDDMDFFEPLDEGLGHSFCYVRPMMLDSPAITPFNSERFTVDSSTLDSETLSGSFRHDSIEDNPICLQNRPSKCYPETTFRTISGASVSANVSTARTGNQSVLSGTDAQEPAASFESTSSFAAIPLQPVPRGSGPLNGFISGPLERGFASGPLERGFASGPLERGFASGPLERGFASGPLEKGGGFMSGPIEKGVMSGPLDVTDKATFSAPLTHSRRRHGIQNLMRSVSGPLKSTLSRTFLKHSMGSCWMQPFFLHPMTRSAWHSKEAKMGRGEVSQNYDDEELPEGEYTKTCNLQWAHGKAGEDRVHVVLSEEQGWLFIGIYDGFSGPDAPEFLMSHLYRAIDKEMEGLLWEYDNKPLNDKPLPEISVNEYSAIDSEASKGAQPRSHSSEVISHNLEELSNPAVIHIPSSIDRIAGEQNEINECFESESPTCVTLGTEPSSVTATKLGGQGRKSMRLFELLQMEAWDEQGSLSISEVDDQIKETISSMEVMQEERTGSYKEERYNCQNEDPTTSGEDRGVRVESNVQCPVQIKVTRKSLISSKIRKMYKKQKSLRKKLFRWNYDWHREETCLDDRLAESPGLTRRCKLGVIDNSAVLRAMARALENTEEAYMKMVIQALDRNPELALMGSCVLVMLMKDQDVYVMNLGDSRAILAQERPNDRYLSTSILKDDFRHHNRSREALSHMELGRISEESPMHNQNSQANKMNKIREISVCRLKMRAVQLSTDHGTNIEEEVLRIKAEHLDDAQAVYNDRVKGQLKVTRAFGAGFLKEPRCNEALLEMFQIDYVGTSPYVSCIPSICHHRLSSSDRFLILSSDGLYQYFSNEEVVAHVTWFIENVPEGDPAQYLIAELLFRAAKKNGMNFHELLDIPNGDRRKYHDDVSVMVISLEGRIWRSSG